MNHNCEQEGTIAEMKSILIDLSKIIKDNGQKGLQTRVIEMSIITEALKDEVTKLTTAVSWVTKFQDETIGEVKAKERYRTSLRWAIGIAFSLGTLLIMVKANILK